MYRDASVGDEDAIVAVDRLYSLHEDGDVLTCHDDCDSSTVLFFVLNSPLAQDTMPHKILSPAHGLCSGNIAISGSGMSGNAF